MSKLILGLFLATGLGVNLTSNAYDINIVCDLGNVLVRANYLKMGMRVGLRRWVAYVMRHPLSFFEITHRLFAFLSTIPSVRKEPHAVDSFSNTGHMLPAVYQEFLAGDRCADSILDDIDYAITNDHFTFKSSAEKELVIAIAESIFNLEHFIDTIELMPQAIEFLQACHERGHKLYLFSNWDADSYDLFAEKHPEFVDLFHGITISGNEGYLKPDITLYKRFLKQHRLDPATCLFIDDQLVNVTACEQVSMNGLLCPVKKTAALFFYTDFDAILEHIDGWSAEKQLTL